MRDSAVRAPHASSRVPIPLLIKCGWAFMAIWAVTMYVTAAVVLFIAAIDAIVNGLPPTSLTLAKGDIPIVSGFIVFAGASGPFAWGVWKERPWTREVAMGFWVGVMFVSVTQVILDPAKPSEDTRGILFPLIVAGIAVWYFYRKHNVLRYYDELKARERGA